MDPDEEKDDSFHSLDRRSDRTRRGSEENGLHHVSSDELDEHTGGALSINAAMRQVRASHREAASARSRSKSAEVKEQTKMQQMQARIAEHLESQRVSVVMTVFTIYSLYEDDARLLATTKEDDPAFLGMITFCFFLFLLELCLLMWVKPGYFCVPKFKEAHAYLEQHGWMLSNMPNALKLVYIGSFDFWLDMIATFTLLMQLTWMIPNEEGATSRAQTHVALIGRAARIGARAGKVVRIVRMIHFAHLMKQGNGHDEKRQDQEFDILGQGYEALNPPPLMHSESVLSSPMSPSRRKSVESLDSMASFSLKRTSSHRGSEASSDSEGEDASHKPPAPGSTTQQGAQQETTNHQESQSRIGAAMSDSTTKRVIALVLLIVVAAPLVTPRSNDSAAEYSVRLVHDFGMKAQSDAAYQDGLNTAVELAKDSAHVLRLVVGGDKYIDKQDLVHDLRPVEKLLIRYKSQVAGDTFVTKAIIDRREAVREMSRYGIGLTSVVLVLLVLGTLAFIADVDRLVILPIEKMVKLVQQISDDPLGVNYSNQDASDHAGFVEGMETSVLLGTINKIGSLMRVGFGEAGAAIIAKNMKSGQKKLDPIAPGTKMQGIFGFCDIRNFTDTTECLQEEVMLFVNRIAFILHGIVLQCQGTANKNIGDAFLLTWKLDDVPPEEQSVLADQALLSFLHTLIEINRYHDFVCDFTHAASARLHKRMPDYKVKMGFGLHVGWAIEGAIGSHRKIDASYISAHVNMTEFLESSTKHYGCTLLMSQPFFDLLTDEARQCCRQVDRVLKLDIASTDIGLYTYDVDPRVQYRPDVRFATMPMRSAVPLLSHRVSSRDPRQSNMPQINSPPKVEREPPTITIEEYDPIIWSTDQDLINLRRQFTTEIQAEWSVGMDAYIEGNWELAMEKFNNIARITNGRDGPAGFLLQIMSTLKVGDDAPPNWHGYREV